MYVTPKYNSEFGYDQNDLVDIQVHALSVHNTFQQYSGACSVIGKALDLTSRGTGFES